MTYAPLTTEDVSALRAFAATEGRRWKSVLGEVYWPNARIWRDPATNNDHFGYVLHGLRNSHGASWLAMFTPGPSFTQTEL